ncbi:short chain dehydrogenase [Colletotrichum incanum]|nr:short chain dehydrogenase [Colletotrichum incanum]
MSSRTREAKPSIGDPAKSTDDLFMFEKITILTVLTFSVTGGGGSVGLEVARSVLESGGDVILIDRQEQPLKDLWDHVLLVSKQHGTLAGLVACAGISGDAPSINFPIDIARRIVDINVLGTLICAQAAGVDTVAHNSSKCAVVQMARSLAAEWGSRADIPLIRVNSISPEQERKWVNGSMLLRLSEAHEYRGPIIFVLSDASSYMTGSDVRVDGGNTYC